jgi:hypothetical protein
MDRIRETAKKRLGDIVRNAAGFQGAPERADQYVATIDATLVERCPTPRRYRDRILFLTANLPAMADELDEIEPALLATINETELRSTRQKSKDEREARKRARHNAISLEDREDVKCYKCGFPVRSRLNMNRFDVEDELLGGQYQNQYDVLCACDADVDPIEKFKRGSQSRSRDGSDDRSSSSSGRDDEPGSRPTALGTTASPMAKAARPENAAPGSL